MKKRKKIKHPGFWSIIMPLIVISIFFGTYPREWQVGAPTIFAGFTTALWILSEAFFKWLFDED
jgi:hypothetical protein